MKLEIDNKSKERDKLNKNISKRPKERDSFNVTYVDLFVREVDKKLQPECYERLCSNRIKTLELWEPSLEVKRIENDKDIPEPYLNKMMRLSEEIVNNVNKIPSGIEYTMISETKTGKEKINEANEKIRQIMKSLGYCVENYENDSEFISINDFSKAIRTKYEKIDKHVDKVKK